MDVIHIEHPFKAVDQFNSLSPLSVAFGNFDGLHAGHQEVISRAIKLANRLSLTSGVMTFHPHPKEVLGSFEQVTYLTPLADKLNLLAQMGIHKAFIINFTRNFASLTPEQFIEQYIINLQVQQVITGFDFCFGNRGTGNTGTLAEWSEKTKQFQVHITPSIDDRREKISSSRIRRHLGEGDLKQVQRLLKRNYSISGIIIDGEKRGRQLGFPTANIKLKEPYVIPKIGVYAVKVTLKGEAFDGVLNIGYKPTFHSARPSEPVMEVHLFDFNENIYHEELTVHFVAYLRGEQKFSSITELKAQINNDILLAKEKLAAGS